MKQLKNKGFVNEPFIGMLLLLFSGLNTLGAQQLISFAGAQVGSSTGAYMGWSVGEIVIQPLASANAFLTQGFRQPIVSEPLLEDNTTACAQNHGLAIYNGLTPNDDNINDYLRIDGIEKYPNNKIFVLNRWHTVIYQKESYSNADGWRGTDQNGSKLPGGIYFYRIYLDAQDDQSFCEGRILIIY